MTLTIEYSKHKSMMASSAERIFVFLAGFLVDIVLLLSGFFFNITPLTFHPVVVCVVVALALVRRSAGLRKRFIVKALFLLLMVNIIDSLALLNAGFWGWHPCLTFAPAVFYLAALRFRSNRFLRWDRLQTLIIPVLVTFLMSGVGNSPSSEEECRAVGSDGVRLVAGASEIGAQGNLVRYVLQLKDSKRILIAYRQGFSLEPFLHPAEFELRALDCIEPGAKSISRWLTGGEVIGLHQSPLDGDVYAVVVYFPPIPDSQSDVDFVRFDEHGLLKQRVPVPDALSCSYSAKIITYKGRILFFVDDLQLYEYDPASGIVRQLAWVDSPSGFSAVRRGAFIYSVAPHSPILHYLGPDIKKYDLRKNRIVRKRGRHLLGYYDIKEIGNSGTFAISRCWTGGGEVIDSNLNKLRALNIPAGTRNIGLDSAGRVLFAPNFFTGRVRVLDMSANRLLPGEFYVGKGTRSMTESRSGTVLVANSCGVVEISPKVWGHILNLKH